MTPYSGNSKPYARAGLMMIGLAWTLPFLQPFHRFPLPSFYAEWLALALGLLALVALLRPGAWDGLSLPAASIAALLLIAVVWLQYFLGLMPYLGQALVPTLYLFWAALLIVVGDCLRRELGIEKVAAVLAWFLLAGGVVSALAGIAQHYQATPLVGTVIPPKRTLQVFGNLSQPNHYAAYAVLAMVSLAYLVTRGRLAIVAAVAAGALLAFAAAISGSRSVWLYLLILPMLAAALYRCDPRPEHRRFAVACTALFPAFVVMNGLAALPWLAPPDIMATTSLDRLFGNASGVSVRLALWEAAWSMFTGAPVLGVGFGQFAWHHFEYQAATGAHLDIGLTNHAHNLPLHLLAETGLIGALLVAGAALHWLAGLRRVRIAVEHAWLLAALAVVGVHSLIEYPLWYSFFLGMAAVIVGLMTAGAVRANLGRVGRLLAGLLLVAGLAHAALLLRDFRSFERLVFAVYRAETDVPAEQVFRDVLTGVYREPLLAPYVDTVITYGIPVTEEKLAEKLALVDRAARFAPAPVVLFRQATLLDLAGQREAAVEQMERTLRVYPWWAKEFVPEVEDLARRYPDRFGALLELARSVARAARRSPP